MCWNPSLRREWPLSFPSQGNVRFPPIADTFKLSDPDLGGKTMSIWTIAGFLAAIYCVARAIQDLRERRYVWAVLGVLAAVAIMAVPIPTHAEKVDIPLN